MEINKANLDDLKPFINLFNDYRSFYRRPIDQNAEAFLAERIRNNESIILIAKDNNQFIGFVQLYPSFSSLTLGRTWILNDLYVAPAFRRKKVAWNLISKTIELARETNAVAVTLSTEISNTNAQELYKKFGFKKDNDFFYFNFKI